MRRSVHLVCNAHIDPVWLWEWPEGAAEALSTFRTAADLCEEFPNFIFNHNEAILYRWIEEYEPALFRRIQRLVRAGRWHILGGWYLQPDCNMPAGESFVRQILLGRLYFREKFGVDPIVAANLDPFGHSRGLVQILALSGYRGYLYCRPSLQEGPVAAPHFRWVGFAESEVTGLLATAHYNSAPGQAGARLRDWLAAQTEEPCTLLLWGIGNHGGGPSRQDLRDLAREIRAASDVVISHSTPERYLAEHADTGPRHAGDLNPWAVGCYTTMSRIKRKHRALENELYATEKMATTAAVQKLMPYPRAALREAAIDLATAEFHDALPGTSTPSVEASLLHTLGHGLEILARIKTRAFFALCAGQRKARPGEFPILIYNPHPHRVRTTIECEMQPQWPHQSERYAEPILQCNGRRVLCQVEKEESNINEDHRKRLVFPVNLAPGTMQRFDCHLELARRPPRIRRRSLHLKMRDLEVRINARTGLIDRYRIRGRDYLAPGAARALVMHDDADPWGMRVRRFRRRAGSFRLMSSTASARFAGVASRSLPPVRVIEDGPVRTMIEALFAYGDSRICQHYILPKHGTEIGITLRVYWAAKDKLLKLSFPTPFTQAELHGQVAYGAVALPANGDEVVAQKWSALVDHPQRVAFTCINTGTYGLDALNGELRLSLLRSPAHAGHPTGPAQPIVQPDRFTPRIDQGEHEFRFFLNGGALRTRLDRVDGEALIRNERPCALSFSPPGTGRRPRAGVHLSDPAVLLTTLKLAEHGTNVILRLFESTGRARITRVSLPFAGAHMQVRLNGFEIKTLNFNRRSRKFRVVDLLEDPLES